MYVGLTAVFKLELDELELDELELDELELDNIAWLITTPQIYLQKQYSMF